MHAGLHIDEQAIAAFCRKWNVAELALFGSVLREDFRPDSDIDVLVTLAPSAELDLFDWMDMREELKHIFGREVDLVEKTTLRNPYRRKAILADSETVYAS